MKLAKQTSCTVSHLDRGEFYPKDPVTRIDHLVRDVPLLGTWEKIFQFSSFCNKHPGRVRQTPLLKAEAQFFILSSPVSLFAKLNVPDWWSGGQCVKIELRFLWDQKNRLRDGSFIAWVLLWRLEWNEALNTCTVYDTVSDVVESKVHQCQQNSDA